MKAAYLTTLLRRPIPGPQAGLPLPEEGALFFREKPAYGLCAIVTNLENAMPSPVEKGDRGAVDKEYPGIKENDTNEKASFPSDTEERRFFCLIHLLFHAEICI